MTTQQDRTGEWPSLIDVVGRPLSVAVRRGSSDRTPLLLMNGIGAPLTTFEPFIDALDHRLEVISFDVPGVGGSPAPSQPYRFRSLARLVARLLDALGYATVDVLGISWVARWPSSSRSPNASVAGVSCWFPPGPGRSWCPALPQCCRSW